MGRTYSAAEVLSDDRKRQDLSYSASEVLGPQTQIAAPVQDTQRESVNPIVNLGRGANEVIADVGQFGVDILRLPLVGASAAYGLATGDYREVPGDDVVRDFFQEAGLVGEQPATGYAARVGREFAQAPAYALPIAKAAQAGTQLTGRFSQYLQPILDYARKSPTKFAAGEGVVATTAALGGEAGSQFGPGGEALGYLAGGLTPAALVSSYGPVTRFARDPLRSFKQAAATTPELEREGAGQILRQNIGEDAAQAVRAYDPEAPGTLGGPEVGGPYTIGEMTGDPSLLNLQARLADEPRVTGVETRGLGRTAEERAGQFEETEIEMRPDATESTAFTRGRVKTAIDKINQRIATVASGVEQKLNTLRPGENVDEIEIAARDEFDSIWNLARKQEQEYWEKIGGVYDTQDLIAGARRIIQEEPEIASDVDSWILKIAGRDKGINSAGEEIPAVPSILDKGEKSGARRYLHDEKQIARIASKISERITKLRKANNFNQARILNEFADELRLLIKVRGGDEQALAEARAFSGRKAEIFKQSGLNRLLESGNYGGRQTPPELTLTRLIPTGPEGKVAAQQLIDAAEQYGRNGRGQVDKIMERYLIARFANQTMRPGEAFNPAAATAFVNDNPVLQLYPKLQAQMMDAAQSQRLATRADKALQKRLKNAENISAASAFLNDDNFLKTIRNSRNPIKSLREMLNLAKKDASGSTLKGIQAKFYEEMMDGVIIDNGVSAVRINKYLKNQTNRQMIRETFGADQLKIFDDFARGATLFKKGFTGKAARADLNRREQQRLRRFVGNTAVFLGGSASRIGASFGGKGLLYAQMARTTANNFVDRIFQVGNERIFAVLDEAMTDPALAKELLQKTPKTDQEFILKFPRLSAILEGGEQSMEAPL